MLWTGFQEAGSEMWITVQGGLRGAWDPHLGKEGKVAGLGGKRSQAVMCLN